MSRGRELILTEGIPLDESMGADCHATRPHLLVPAGIFVISLQTP